MFWLGPTLVIVTYWGIQSFPAHFIHLIGITKQGSPNFIAKATLTIKQLIGEPSSQGSDKKESKQRMKYHYKRDASFGYLFFCRQKGFHGPGEIASRATSVPRAKFVDP